MWPEWVSLSNILLFCSATAMPCAQSRSLCVIFCYFVVSLSNDMDPERVSLYDPPPAYEEAIDTILYPPTPQMNRVI